jgi:formylglycine-generating enzyme required for sulfatase activity
MGNNPSFFKGRKRFPVEQLSWHDCQTFTKKLGELLRGGVEFRLPTEAEWEHACRAGTSTPFWLGDKLAPDAARYDNKNLGRGSTLAVGSFRPNPWGIYDTIGNVMEWCQNGHYPYSKENQVDPKGPSTSSLRMVRGGCCASSPPECRSGARGAYSSSDPAKTYNLTGLRVLLVVPVPGPTPSPDLPAAPSGPKTGQ